MLLQLKSGSAGLVIIQDLFGNLLILTIGDLTEE